MKIKTENMIFVFGSNLAGRHGAGAALYAANHREAKYGIGVGRTGSCYALPTKDYRIQTLPLEHIKVFVDEFIQYAREHPEHQFQITCIGCGLAGLKHEQIAPMFRDASREVKNLWFDTNWKNYLCVNAQFWGKF